MAPECAGPPGGRLALPGSEEPGSSPPSAGKASAVWPLPQTPSVSLKKSGPGTGAGTYPPILFSPLLETTLDEDRTGGSSRPCGVSRVQP